MYKFDEFCVKWEDHNVAIIENKENNVINDWPTVRIRKDKSYELGLTLYKWKLQPSGNMLAIYPMGYNINENDIFWTNPPQSEHFISLQEKLQSIIKNLKSSDKDALIEDIENGSCKDVIIFKYHANQWRPIEKKKTKWAYIGKQEKTDICNVQRLLE